MMPLSVKYCSKRQTGCSIAFFILLVCCYQSALSDEKTEKTPASHSLIKLVLKPITDEISNVIEESIKASFTSSEWKFLLQYSESVDAFERIPDVSDGITSVDNNEKFYKWIANGRGEVDTSFPLFVQILSVTKFDKPKLLLQHAKVSSAKQGGNHAYIWTRVDCLDGVERIEFTGVFRVKIKQGVYVLARSFRSFEFHKGKWRPAKEKFEWIQNLPLNQ